MKYLVRWANGGGDCPAITDPIEGIEAVSLEVEKLRQHGDVKVFKLVEVGFYKQLARSKIK